MILTNFLEGMTAANRINNVWAGMWPEKSWVTGWSPLHFP